MQYHTKAIDIRTRRRLRLPILLRRSISGRTKGHRIPGLPRLEMARNTKINQRDPPIGPQHHVRRLKVAEDDSRLAVVQVFEDRAEHKPDLQHLPDRQPRFEHLLQVFLQRRTLNEIHRQVPALGIRKVIVNARQVGMLQARQHHHLAVKSLGSLDHLLRLEPTQRNRLNSHRVFIKQRIHRLIDRAKPALAHLGKNTIALLQQVLAIAGNRLQGKRKSNFE